MQPAVPSHPPEETMERYILDQLPEELAAPFEEHVLLCENCQIHLDSVENHLRLGQAAARELRREAELRKQRRWSWFPVTAFSRPVMAGALGALVIAVGLPVYRISQRQETAVTVALRSSRGAGERVVSHARAGKIIIEVDARQLPPQPSYRVELVDSGGAAIWSGTANSQAQRLVAPIAPRLDPGQYWIRLYGLDGTAPIKEFGLDVR